MNAIRSFFQERDYLEVETPILSHAANPEPCIQKMMLRCDREFVNKNVYLQTSPEFHMKRLLAAGSGPIYQIGKAFRQGEMGRYHNPEFSILEWYRPGFDHHDLMTELDELLQVVLNIKSGERFSYQEIFQKYLDINPHHASIELLIACASQHDITTIGVDKEDKDVWLQLLLTHIIEPQLGLERPCFIYDYPGSQAALAKIRHGEQIVAERFEVYIRGIELANGYHELCDPQEQRERFQKDIEKRQQTELPEIPMDEYFLQALSAGLPACSGVALGLDRLILLATGSHKISDVISFDWQRA